MVYTIVVHLLAKEDQESISKLSAKLVEASQVYSKDKETLSWFVMQDTVDPRKFTIVERYEQESVRSPLQSILFYTSHIYIYVCVYIFFF
jgi:quinol monooxygenase YgiN